MIAPTNGDQIHIKIGPRDSADSRSLIEAYFRNNCVYRDRLDPDMGFVREGFVKRLKSVMQSNEDWRRFEQDQAWKGWKHGPKDENEEDPFNNFRWIDGYIATEAAKLATEIEDSFGPVPIGELFDTCPNLRPPVVGKLLRRGETGNLISTSKVGKSWLLYGLIMCKVMGWDWLDQFPCEPGRVLLIDNELHKETLSHRLKHVSDVMGVDSELFRASCEVISLRGRLLDLHGIARVLVKVNRGDFDLILLDAFYRSLPKGCSENDNATIAQLFNLVDGIAERLDVGWLNVHHASKGSQSEKAIVDVGAGAGSQSRAADCHVILRAHDDPTIQVMEGVVRSFAPIEPLAVKYEYPIWIRADADTTLLKGRLSKSDERKQQSDKRGVDSLIDALRKCKPEALTNRKLRAKTGLGKDRIERLLETLVENGDVTTDTTTVRGNPCTVYRLA